MDRDNRQAPTYSADLANQVDHWPEHEDVS
jgi:hypothetical protein